MWEVAAVVVVAATIFALKLNSDMNAASLAAQRQAKVFSDIKADLEANFDSKESQQRAIVWVNSIDQNVRAIWSRKIYEVALEGLTRNPESVQARVFTLQTGRLHRGACRVDGIVTIYDEQAIQNDIMVRCGAASQSLR